MEPRPEACAKVEGQSFGLIHVCRHQIILCPIGVILKARDTDAAPDLQEKHVVTWIHGDLAGTTYSKLHVWKWRQI